MIQVQVQTIHNWLDRLEAEFECARHSSMLRAVAFYARFRGCLAVKERKREDMRITFFPQVPRTHP